MNDSYTVVVVRNDDMTVFAASNWEVELGDLTLKQHAANAAAALCAQAGSGDVTISILLHAA